MVTASRPTLHLLTVSQRIQGPRLVASYRIAFVALRCQCPALLVFTRDIAWHLPVLKNFGKNDCIAQGLMLSLVRPFFYTQHHVALPLET